MQCYQVGMALWLFELGGVGLLGILSVCLMVFDEGKRVAGLMLMVAVDIGRVCVWVTA